MRGRALDLSGHPLPLSPLVKMSSWSNLLFRRQRKKERGKHLVGGHLPSPVRQWWTRDNLTTPRLHSRLVVRGGPTPGQDLSPFPPVSVLGGAGTRVPAIIGNRVSSGRSSGIPNRAPLPRRPPVGGNEHRPRGHISGPHRLRVHRGPRREPFPRHQLSPLTQDERDQQVRPLTELSSGRAGRVYLAQGKHPAVCGLPSCCWSCPQFLALP